MKAVFLKGVDYSGASLSNSGSFLGSQKIVLFDKRSHNQTGPQIKRKGGLFYQIYFLEHKRHQILINPIDFQIFDVCSSVQLQDVTKKEQ